MRVTFEPDGGFAVFPGLRRPLELDTADLPSATASRLEELVRAAADSPAAAAGSAPGAADQRTYRITVADQAGTRTWSYVEPVSGPARDLVGYLEDLRRQR
ncbi:protealysin inhibitor emfourin [Amycolatopsis sp. H20-H5]|uniref:protealysin inhibitor emfourin n=1 Tax=Amycolatopsis sp. H20-H5 TaxID=3046309 RepID=UPI002DBBF4C7|nr:protealysin inhibitor emfourin [Amycolatopsis sp. H20-H5]MEC3982626.1 protealysin inhibitor emfourin [Amycolatopsis sp. H20-H5]